MCTQRNHYCILPDTILQQEAIPSSECAPLWKWELVLSAFLRKKNTIQPIGNNLWEGGGGKKDHNLSLAPSTAFGFPVMADGVIQA